GARARSRGADRRRGGRSGRRRRRIDVRHRRGGEHRGAPSAGGGAGRDHPRPHRASAHRRHRRGGGRGAGRAEGPRRRAVAVALGVLGAAEDGRSPAELTWAVTIWAERLADAQPLVLVFEDVHWADDPLLNVIEHLARSLRNAPVLIICVARPDLLDTRPTW